LVAAMPSSVGTCIESYLKTFFPEKIQRKIYPKKMPQPNRILLLSKKKKKSTL